MAEIQVRVERDSDEAAVRAINDAAFGRPAEGILVDRLRGLTGVISLVATDGSAVVGHIMFSPIALEPPQPGARAAGLAPMAVAPAMQRRGIGGRLVVDGIEACRRAGYGLVFVLGHPDYYPRFGFVPASRRGFRCEWTVPDEAFMALDLTSGAAPAGGGLARYLPQFADVEEDTPA